MRRNFLLGGALCALLLAAVPVQAKITAFLDNPIAGPLSGNDLVSGWAFAIVDGSPVDVMVTVRIDGVNQNEVLCCSERADVQDANPGAPLDTGFASLIPYGELTQGPHTIGVEITAAGCDPVIIDRSIQVVKAADANFIQNMDFSGATFKGLSDGFDADDVSVQLSEDLKDSADIEVMYSRSSQSLLITGPPSEKIEYFFANLNGSQEVDTPVDTPASGSGAFILNGDNSLYYEVLTSGVVKPFEIAGSASHIHMEGAGANGGVIAVLKLKDGSTTDWEGTTDPLTEEQRDALLNGELYINVHTEANMPGEIRGQIVASDTCEARSMFTGAPLQPAAQGTNTEGCRELGDQSSCEAGWQLNPSDRNAVSCSWSAMFGCGACGPQRDDCKNVCN